MLVFGTSVVVLMAAALGLSNASLLSTLGHIISGPRAVHLVTRELLSNSLARTPPTLSLYVFFKWAIAMM